jgi:hypothetical protein
MLLPCLAIVNTIGFVITPNRRACGGPPTSSRTG